ncbi:cache domain-containing protein [bacterium]|nr:cache domain-containing protein [bacterium]
MTKTMRLVTAACLALSLIAGCGGDGALWSEKQYVEQQLDAFVASLEADPPTDAELPGRIRVYLDENTRFYGSTVTKLDAAGRAYYAPYLYRLPEGPLTEKDLAAEPGYDIDSQPWLTEPIAARAGIWTEPYFDAGGGEIWMVTRSVPVFQGNRIVAVATTDVPVRAPKD